MHGKTALKIYIFLFIINNNPEKKIQALRNAPMAFPISNIYQKI